MVSSCKVNSNLETREPMGVMNLFTLGSFTSHFNLKGIDFISPTYIIDFEALMLSDYASKTR